MYEVCSNCNTENLKMRDSEDEYCNLFGRKVDFAAINCLQQSKSQI